MAVYASRNYNFLFPINLMIYPFIFLLEFYLKAVNFEKSVVNHFEGKKVVYAKCYLIRKFMEDNRT